MGNILYAIAILFFVAWAIGFLGFNTSGIIHIFLTIAIIAAILRILMGKKTTQN